MPIILTGDVHQAIGSADQRCTRQSETALAVTYAQIAARYGLKVTLFFTGRALIENGTEARPLLSMGNVEIAGHGWNALQPWWWHGLLHRVLGSPHGPQWLQRRMIRRTCTTLSQYTGHPVRSWRNHAYRYDPLTPYVLAQAGIRAWSDEVDPQRYSPSIHPSGLLSLPINTLPDHETLAHGTRTPPSVACPSQGLFYSPSQWYEAVSGQIETIMSRHGLATILAHPICMHIADDWDTFTRLCAFLARYPSQFAGDVVWPL
jgi:hypothetical protein